MTIQFNCPNCDALIAFDSKHAGKRARCQTCGQLFIIPSKDNEVPRRIEPKIEKAESIPGFYRALFIDSWKLFIDPQNVTSLAFVVAAVGFKFFLGKAICCVNYITFIVVWGWLLGFYLNIIYETAFEIDTLPQIYLGSGIAFFWNIIKPFFIFFCTMVIVQLPFIITLMLLQDKGLTFRNFWQLEFGWRLLLQLLFIIGLFLFPMAILTAAIGRDPTLFRPDYFLLPIYRTAIPYLLIVAFLAAACLFEIQTKQFDVEAPLLITVLHLTLNLSVQVIAIVAMRSIGLFYRHYSCHLPW